MPLSELRLSRPEEKFRSHSYYSQILEEVSGTPRGATLGSQGRVQTERQDLGHMPLLGSVRWSALGFLGYDWIGQFKPKEWSLGKLDREGHYPRGTPGEGPGRQGRLLITTAIGEFLSGTSMFS